MIENENKSLKEQAYSHIKKQIINNIIKPGEPIDEKKYVSELGISRTPVHEAITTLSTEGLVSIIPRKGITASFLRIRDILGIYEVRLMLEPPIIRKIADSVSAEKLSAFKREFNNTKMISATASGRDLDSEFHLYLAECTRNQILIDTEERLLSQSQRIRILSSFADSKSDDDARHEHIEMIDSILSDDISRAEEVCRSHLEKSVERYNTIYAASNFII
ncbi:GntR family transcriptional regulator [Treponema parvum]|uniref:GntR family transcriptional regulator n=1 Tax=Treponema parvum TaxID=138851 RepID=A0A975EZI2_9SPIR|nr:GntR family transcriptional regulator [Treponema parvum]QTQ11598.1 GntR family transcriptional regulator [Treponema parvum]QTQ14215.1 GntR family transcriptional regulator [Treponema parvum]